MYLKSILESLKYKKRLNLEKLSEDEFLEFLSILDENNISYMIDFNELKEPTGVICYSDIKDLYENFLKEIK